MLLAIFAVIGHDGHTSHRSDLALYNILQITFSIEFVLCVPGILWYLGELSLHSIYIYNVHVHDHRLVGL